MQRSVIAAELTGIASLAVRDLLNGPRREGRIIAVIRGSVFAEFPNAPYEPRVIALCGREAMRLPNAIVAIDPLILGPSAAPPTPASAPTAVLTSPGPIPPAPGTTSAPAPPAAGTTPTPAPPAVPVSPAAPSLVPGAAAMPGAAAAVTDLIVAAASPRPVRGRPREPVVYIGGGMLRIGGLVVRGRRWWDPSPVFGPLSRTRLDHGVTTLSRIITEPAGRAWMAGVADVRALAACCANGDLAGAVEHAEVLVGLGPGMVPGGDGVLCGMLLALRLLGGALPGGTRAVWLADWLSAAVTGYARQRTTPLAASVLHCASRGQASAEVAAVLHGMTGEEALEPAVRTLLAADPSGILAAADLAWGLVSGCRAAQVLSVS